MKRSLPASGVRTLDKSLLLLDAVARRGPDVPFAILASELGVPGSTARRIALALQRRGLIVRCSRGRLAAGLTLAELGGATDVQGILKRSGRAVLRELAAGYEATAHLAILEGNMATYLLKEGPTSGLFTREGGQLEAYCSGVGKMMIAALPEPERECYLAEGPFFALTDRTIIDPDRLRSEFAEAAARGFAVDDQEVADGLYCVAVPVRGCRALANAAISLSGPKALLGARPIGELVGALRAAAFKIERLGGLRS